nr:MAG TPA: hypothetical protein [Caudoviricetes sp.]
MDRGVVFSFLLIYYSYVYIIRYKERLGRYK